MYRSLLLALACLTGSLGLCRAAPGDLAGSPDTTFAPSWGENGVFYHLFVDRFRDGDPRSTVPGQAPWDSSIADTAVRRGGDFVGLKDGLSYLEDLGVDGVIFDGWWQSEDPLGRRPLNLFETEPLQGSNKYFHTTITDGRQRGFRILLGCRWLEVSSNTRMPPEQAEFSAYLAGKAPAPGVSMDAPGLGSFLDQVANVWVRYNAPDGLWVYGADSSRQRDTLLAHVGGFVHRYLLPRKLILWDGEPITAGESELELLARLCLPGRVVLEYGEEVGLWKGGVPGGFPRTMAWSPGRQDLIRLERVRRVLKARKDHPALARGELGTAPVQESKVRWFTRRSRGEIVLAAFNESDEARRVSVPAGARATPGAPEMILGDAAAIQPPGADGASILEIPAHGAWIGAFHLAP